ncbi:MAG: thioredoxin reductase [Deltaproteobacteria bacterium]|nr:MAG: thioredoxin reductase [Deltaproteobacteria bacterium]
MKTYDTVILGAGPAGMSAAVYGTRYNLSMLVIGRDFGTITETDEISNYLGFPSASGTELAKKFTAHLKDLGGTVRYEEILDIKPDGGNFTVTTNRDKYTSRTVIYCLGGVKRKLGLPEEERFAGKGVSYCSTCDAAFFRNKTVAVAGGRNSAAMSALLLSRLAKKVYIIYRGDRLKAFPSSVRSVEKTGNITVILDSVIREIKGKDSVESLVLENLKTGERRDLRLDGIFVEFGHIPNSGLAKKAGAETLDDGRIITDSGMSTNIRGLFAAGDVTSGSNGFEQVITAASEGAIAAQSAYKIISGGG